MELTEQHVSPTLTISITAELDIRTKDDGFRDLGAATVTFISITDRREYGDPTTEFNFQVDGKRVRGGPANSSPMTDKREKDSREIVIGAIDTSALEEIGRGRDVKMKIGDQVITLDQTVIKNIAEFVRVLVK